MENSRKDDQEMKASGTGQSGKNENETGRTKKTSGSKKGSRTTTSQKK